MLHPKLMVLATLEVRLLRVIVIVIVAVTGGEQSEPSLPLDGFGFGWSLTIKKNSSDH